MMGKEALALRVGLVNQRTSLIYLPSPKWPYSDDIEFSGSGLCVEKEHIHDNHPPSQCHICLEL